MMVEQIFLQASSEGVLLYLKDDRLAYRTRQGALSEQLKQRIIEHKNDILQYLARQQQTALLPVVRSTDRSGLLPLSFAQQRLWLMHQIEGSSSHYHIQVALQLDGELDQAALFGSLEQIVRRHEVLRTVFVNDDAGNVWQQVLTDWQPAWQWHEVPHWQDDELLAAVHQESQRGFDLRRDLMLRVRVFRRSSRLAVLQLTMHHIAADGWSVPVLVRELVSLYQAQLQQRDAGLTPLPVQYGDYANWQLEYLQGEVLRQQLDYWQQQLAGLPLLHQLPLTHARPQQQSFAGATVYSELSPALTQQLKQFCQQAGATLFMGLHTAFSALLARYSHESDIVIGTPVANREQAEVEALIGFFVNTLVLRLQVGDELSFAELLQQSRQHCLAAYAHQQIPFDKLVEVLRVERSLSHSPLFQVMLALQNNEQSELALPGLKLKVLEENYDVAKYDLTLTAYDAGQGLALAWNYSTALFSTEFISGLAKHFTHLLTAMLATPDAAIATLPLLSYAENALLSDWNQTDSPYPSQLLVHQLFEQQAQCQPMATAVICDRQQLSYQELNGRANQLARYLLEHRAVQPEQLVGVCLERSPELVVALLAVLKAGAAYVPLDPAYPQERLTLMCQDAALQTVLTLTAHGDWLATAERVVLDSAEVSQALQGYSTANLTESTAAGLCTDSSALAYVIYTSGSTGRPKGVMVEHRNLMSMCSWHIRQFELDQQSVGTMTASMAFDASAWELWPYLLAGGRVVQLSTAQLFQLSELPAYLNRHDVTHSFLVTPLALQFIQHCPPAQLQQCTLKYLLVGGDTLPWLDVGALPFKLVNNYGPTETTVVATSGLVDMTAGQPDIGRAISNTRLYVLDRLLQPVPVGVTGELYIAGAGVARGYLGRPELTAERFIDAATTGLDVRTEPGRLYRSGDLVQWRPDGQLRYIGRNDDQVKIRGYRIELGEIEKALLAVTGIREALVLTHDHPTGGKVLIGYYTTDDATSNGSATAEDIKSQLSGMLPEYMVPAQLLALPEFPLTPHGKIDRKALPLPDVSVWQREYQPPVTATEQLLAGLWRHLLQVQQVGLQDNFFALGGHSLLATRLTSQLKQQMGLEVPVRELFEHSQLGQFAARLDQLELSQNVPAMRPVDRSVPLPLTYAQQRLWLQTQIDHDSSHYHISAALWLHGVLDRSAFDTAIATVLSRHEVLRTVFREDEQGDVWQQVLMVPAAPVEWLDGRDWSDAELQRWLQQQQQRPFDLSRDLMLRVSVCQRTEQSVLLQLTVHHIAADGWSLSLLVQELTTSYRSLLQQEVPALPALPLQYGDYACWQRSYLQGAVLQRQLAYWQQQLANLPLLHSVPLDYERPASRSSAGATFSSRIDSARTLQLKTLCQQQDATLFMGLHTVFSVLLSRYSHEMDIVIGTPVANREQAEVAELIGFFVNTLVLRLQLPAEADFLGLLRQSRRCCLDAYAHQQVPFEKLVDLLQVERNLSYSPLFQISLILQNNATAELALPGLQLQPVLADGHSAKYDLTLNVTEADGQLWLDWNYHTEIFAAATVQQLAGHFERLLAALLEQPTQAVHALPLLSPAELAELEHWNQTEELLPRQLPVTELIRQTIARQPQQLAVQDEHGADTYAEMAAKAALIQQQLPWSPVPQIVAIYGQRQRGVIAAMLAALCGGHSYLLLEPALPAERVCQILQDSQATVLVCDADVTVPAAVSLPQIRLDRLSGALSAAPALHYASLTGAELAYLIYTSGSTGAPKGVQVPHRGLADYCAFALQHYYQPSGLTGSWLITSPCFDISVPALLLPLMAGGCVRLLPGPDVIESAAELLQEQYDAPVLLRMTPSHVQGLLALLPAGWSSQARHCFVIGGEAFKTADARALAAIFPSSRIINHYGPSETVVGSTWWPLTDHPERLATESAAVLPIGVPMSNTKAYVVSAEGQLQPEGAIGELWLSGVCVTDGYLNQAALTAQKFVPNPFSVHAEYQHCYRTGDLVRRRRGALLFLGRQDTQIKLRGFRVEVGEIEAALCQIAPICQAAVKKLADRESLVAWLVCSNSDWQADQIKTRLATLLPAHLIPELLVQVDVLPLSANGKVDYRALPAVSADVSNSQVVPANPTELLLCQLWAQLLQTNAAALCVETSFFSQGGNSVLAVRLAGLIRQKFDCQWRVRRLFELVTVRQQAKALLQQTTASPSQELILELRAGEPTDPTLVLLHPVEGDITAYRQLAELFPAGCRILAVAQPQAMTGQIAVVAIAELARQYLTALQPYLAGVHHLLGWSMGGLLAIEMARQLRQTGRAVGYVGALDSGLVPQQGIWQQLQSQGDVSAQLAMICRQLGSDLSLRQQFDQAFQLEQLSALQDVSTDELRQQIVTNMVVSRAYVSELAAEHTILPYLHYVSATGSADIDSVNEHSELRRLHAKHARRLATTVVLTEVTQASHFTLLRPPYLSEVIKAVSQQLNHFNAGQS